MFKTMILGDARLVKNTTGKINLGWAKKVKQAIANCPAETQQK